MANTTEWCKFCWQNAEHFRETAEVYFWCNQEKEIPIDQKKFIHLCGNCVQIAKTVTKEPIRANNIKNFTMDGNLCFRNSTFIGRAGLSF